MSHRDHDLRELARAARSDVPPPFDVRAAVMRQVGEQRGPRLSPMERTLLWEATAATCVACGLTLASLRAWEVLTSPMNALLGAMQAGL